MNPQPSTNSNKDLQKIINVDINTNLLSTNILYSLKLAELNKTMDIKFDTIQSARLAYVVLNHFNRYHRNIQNDLIRLYNIRSGSAAMILNRLTDAGLVIKVNTKRKTNLGLFVSLTAYQITSKGKCMVCSLNALIDLKLSSILGGRN